MKKTWVLSVSENTADFYRANLNFMELEHVKKFSYARDLETPGKFSLDKPGVIENELSGGEAGIDDSYMEGNDFRYFTMDVADYANTARAHMHYDELYILGPFKVMNCMKERFSVITKKSIMGSYDVNPASMSTDEILDFLNFTPKYLVF